MSATILSDPPNQPSLSSILVPPTQPLPAQTITLSTNFLESLLTWAITVAATVSGPAPQAIVQPSVSALAAEPATPPPFVAAATGVLPLGMCKGNCKLDLAKLAGVLNQYYSAQYYIILT